MSFKPLGCRSYGSIPHLPNSRLGPADRCLDEGMSGICVARPRDKFDRIYVEEKLDGANVGVCKHRGKILALHRAGFEAHTCPHEQYHVFSRWVKTNAAIFDSLLTEGERICGEWLAQAIGTRYLIPARRTPNPFVPFDIFRPDNKRVLREEFWERLDWTPLHPAHLVSGPPDGCVRPEDLLERCPEYGFHGALEPFEGFVYRVERRNRVDFLAKWVRPDKIDGKYLESISGNEPIWNWKPLASA